MDFSTHSKLAPVFPNWLTEIVVTEVAKNVLLAQPDGRFIWPVLNMFKSWVHPLLEIILLAAVTSVMLFSRGFPPIRLSVLFQCPLLSLLLLSSWNLLLLDLCSQSSVTLSTLSDFTYWICFHFYLSKDIPPNPFSQPRLLSGTPAWDSQLPVGRLVLSIPQASQVGTMSQIKFIAFFSKPVKNLPFPFP